MVSQACLEKDTLLSRLRQFGGFEIVQISRSSWGKGNAGKFVHKGAGGTWGSDIPFARQCSEHCYFIAVSLGVCYLNVPSSARPLFSLSWENLTRT